MKRKTNYQIVPVTRRFETGLIATTSDGASRHFVGNGREATRALADYCDRHGLRVVCISTPGTIYRDLQGTRRTTETTQRRHRVTAEAHTLERFALPEQSYLAAIGRLDLVAT